MSAPTMLFLPTYQAVFACHANYQIRLVCRESFCIAALHFPPPSRAIRCLQDIAQLASKTLLDQLCQAFPQESQQMTLMVTSILSIAISVPSIGLRWLARCKTSQLGWDDYTALVATTLLLLLAALQLESKLFSLEHHGQFPYHFCLL